MNRVRQAAENIRASIKDGGAFDGFDHVSITEEAVAEVDKIEAAIREAARPLVEALRHCHAALEYDGYSDDPEESEPPFLLPAMIAARKALADWEAK